MTLDALRTLETLSGHRLVLTIHGMVPYRTLYEVFPLATTWNTVPANNARLSFGDCMARRLIDSLDSH